MPLSREEREANDKASKRRHYELNRRKYIEQARRKQLELSTWVRDYKTCNPCVDCDVKYPPPVMEFDHREGENKIKNVSELCYGGSWQKLFDEIAKCDLVCANCHRMRTATRGNWIT